MSTMTLVRAKIDDGSFHDFAYNAETGLYELEMQVPNETSYHKPGHYFPITFEAWNNNNVHVSYDDTDATFGSELRVRVRELVSPIITLVSPASPYVVDEPEINIVFNVTDLGGSLLDPDTITIKFGDTDFTPENEYVTLEAITNGYQVTFNPPYFVQDGSYPIKISALDNDENKSIVSFIYTVDTDPCEFVYDRTMEDVARVKELSDKWKAGTITEDEKTEFLQPMKGARNREDFQRILTALGFLFQKFDLAYQLYALPEIPREAYVQYLVNGVKYLRDNVPIHADTPYTPKLPINTHTKMNDIERILFDAHENLAYRFTYYCDDGFYLDAEIGLT